MQAVRAVDVLDATHSPSLSRKIDARYEEIAGSAALRMQG
jgi:hypothetical protein